MSDQLQRLKSALADRYTIERELGAGGMATVYLAEDLKHRRKVALKVLRPDLAATLGSERFIREIEIAANLTHPHILMLIDSGEAGGFLYYVLPYIDGESLRDKLVREGELPVGEAIRILRDIVDGLASAHAQNVVHRDIKPENVMLSGRHALVTDFGVAKAVTEATGRQKLTTAGVALGTPAYMSPEQAAADPHIDHRADIYAVGALAYELLAGRPPFTGDTPHKILAAHTTQAPEPVTKYRDTVLPALAQLVMRCLEKKPADRWQTAEELLRQLEGLTTPSAGMTPTDTRPITVATRTSSRIKSTAIIGVAAVIVIGLAATTIFRRDPITITISNPRQITSTRGFELDPVLSPDGQEVVYAAGPLLQTHLEYKDLGLLANTIQLGGDGPGYQRLPRWTANGDSIVFESCLVGELCSTRITSKLGGAARTFDVPQEAGRNYALSPDGARLVYAIRDSVFVRSIGDKADVLLTGTGWPRDFAPLHDYPNSFAWSPDGGRIALVYGNGTWGSSYMLGDISFGTIMVVAADGGPPVTVFEHEGINVSPVWLPDNRHLLFVSDHEVSRGIYVVEVGRDGAVGAPRRLPGGGNPHSISISADGRTLAYANLDFTRNIVAFPITNAGTTSIRDGNPVTTGTELIENHGVSADEEWIVYDSRLAGRMDIHKIRTDGSGREQLTSEHTNWGPQWSPDRTEILFNRFSTESVGVYLMSAEGGHESRVASQVFGAAKWLPDGLGVVFNSFEFMVMTTSRDSVGAPWNVPRQITDFPCWWPSIASDGERIVCRTIDSDMTSEEVSFFRNSSVVVLSRDGRELQRFTPPLGDIVVMAWPAFSWDGSAILFAGIKRDGSRGIWSIPSTGGEPTMLVDIDDPSLHQHGAISAGTEHIYLSVGEFQSDIWVMDLTIN